MAQCEVNETTMSDRCVPCALAGSFQSERRDLTRVDSPGGRDDER